MTVESKIATLSDWLKRFAPVFQPPCTRDLSRASTVLHIVARNCDWFIALPAPVVIGFGFGFKKSFENRSHHSLLDFKIRSSIHFINPQFIATSFIT